MSMLEPDPDTPEEPIWSDAPGSPAFEARAARLGGKMHAAVRAAAAEAARAAAPVYVLRHLETNALYQQQRTAQASAWSALRGAADYLANPNHRLPSGTPVCELYTVRAMPRGQFLTELAGAPYLLDGRPQAGHACPAKEAPNA